MLKPELAAVVGAERFLAEIKTTARLASSWACRTMTIEIRNTAVLTATGTPFGIGNEPPKEGAGLACTPRMNRECLYRRHAH